MIGGSFWRLVYVCAIQSGKGYRDELAARPHCRGAFRLNVGLSTTGCFAR